MGKKKEVGIRTDFIGDQDHVDTVVFVHGIVFGHYRNTWKNIFQLLPRDKELPKLDILAWGYESGVVRGEDIPHDGERLSSHLRTLIRAENSIVLVGHSLGGLVILQSLCRQMQDGRALDRPCCQTEYIVLFGTPLNGHWFAKLIKKIIPIKHFINKQFRSLGNSNYCNQIIDTTQSSIYAPKNEGLYSKRIPIQLNIGTKDKVVSSEDRKNVLAKYQNPQARLVDGNHSTIKEPPTMNEIRYRNIKEDIQEGILVTFVRLSEKYMGVDQLEKDHAWAEIIRRYEKIARYCVGKIFPINLQKKMVNEVLALAAQGSLRRRMPPSRHILDAARAINSQLSDGR